MDFVARYVMRYCRVMRTGSERLAARETLVDEIRRLALAAGAAEPRSPAHHELHRQLAGRVIDLRETVIYDGEPDWRGRSAEYRELLREALGDLPDAQRRKLLSSLRYSIGNLIRERLPEAELERLGLQRETPRERGREARSAQFSQLRAMHDPGTQPGVYYSVLASLLARGTLGDLRGLPVPVRREVRSALRRIEKLARERLDALNS